MKLLAALEKVKQRQQPPAGSESGRHRARISDMASAKPMASVNLPLDPANVGLKVGARFI